MNQLSSQAIPPTNAVLSTLEREYGCKIASVAAVGARARDTCHEGSDVDLFAIGVQSPSEYPILGDTTIVREFETFDLGPGVDVHLWSPQEFMDGVMDDNPTAIQGILSPTRVRKGAYDAWSALEPLIREEANTYQLLHHYRSLAKDNFERYLSNGSDQTASRTFQVVDALARASYIESTGEIPPYSSSKLNSEMVDPDIDWGTISGTHDDLLDLTHNQLIMYKIGGQGNEELADTAVVGDVFPNLSSALSDIDREIRRDREEYDYDKYGGGVDGDAVRSLLLDTVDAIWQHADRDESGARFIDHQ